MNLIKIMQNMVLNMIFYKLRHGRPYTGSSPKGRELGRISLMPFLRKARWGLAQGNAFALFCMAYLRGLLIAGILELLEKVCRIVLWKSNQ